MPGPTQRYTDYVAIVGPRAAWSGATSRTIDDFGANASNTILIVENRRRPVPWTAPDDLTIAEIESEFARDLLDTRGGHLTRDFFFEYESAWHTVGFVNRHTGEIAYRRDLAAQLFPYFLIDKPADFRPDDAYSGVTTPRAARLRIGNCLRLTVWMILTLWPLGWVRRRRTVDRGVRVPVTL